MKDVTYGGRSVVKRVCLLRQISGLYCRESDECISEDLSVEWRFVALGGLGFFFFFQAEDGIRDADVTGVQTCALPICRRRRSSRPKGSGCPPEGTTASCCWAKRPRSSGRSIWPAAWPPPMHRCS